MNKILVGILLIGGRGISRANPAGMRIVVNENTLLFSPYEPPSRPYAFLYGALHTGRNLTDDLVTTATLQLHDATMQDVSKRCAPPRQDAVREGIPSFLVAYLF